VADEFAGDDLDAVRIAAQTDPRLHEALSKADDGRVTQYLAGVPMLVERYRTAPALARAVIHTAMDARRLDHPPMLPISALEAGARDYLTPVDRPRPGESWLDAVLAEIGQPRYGIQGPVTIVEVASGLPEPVCRLADYLEELGRAERAGQVPPASFWEAGFGSRARWRTGQPDDMAATATRSTEQFSNFFRSNYRYLVKYSRVLGATGHDADKAVGAAMTRLETQWPMPGDPLPEARRITVVQLAEIRRAATDLAVHATSAWHDEDQVRQLLSAVAGPMRDIVESLVQENDPEEIAALFGATAEDALSRIAEISAEFESPPREER
jgi:hypothetical protein